jgi:hypothetical protein
MSRAVGEYAGEADMKNRLAGLLIASIVLLMAATPSPAQTHWRTLAPAGEGFSIEVPGEPQQTGEPGHYVYGDADQAFIIKIDPVSPTIKELVEARAREPLTWFLDKIASGLTNHGKATLLSSSSADFETSGELERSLESELARLAPGSDGDALAAGLNGPAGPAILRNCGLIQFVSTVMASDPNGPKAGERAWGDKMRALKTVFDERAGSAIPQDDGTHAADLSQYMAGPAHRVSMDLWNSVVGKATNQLDGAINLMMFDDRENILREIEAAVAAAK